MCLRDKRCWGSLAPGGGGRGGGDLLLPTGGGEGGIAFVDRPIQLQ